MPDRLNFISDRYCDQDQLGFERHISVLADMIQSPGFKTPFCIGIDGKWGSGKTSFMHLLEEKLKSNETQEPLTVPVWFNPWRYGKEEHLIIPFLKTIEKAVNDYCDKFDKEGVASNVVSVLRNAALRFGQTATAFAYGLTLECKFWALVASWTSARRLNGRRSLRKEKMKKGCPMPKPLPLFTMISLVN